MVMKAKLSIINAHTNLKNVHLSFSEHFGSISQNLFNFTRFCNLLFTSNSQQIANYDFKLKRVDYFRKYDFFEQLLKV